jgi:hypothetical protein
MASEAQLEIPKPTIKRIVKEKLASAAGSSEGSKADVQLNKEALLAFGESAKVQSVTVYLFVAFAWPFSVLRSPTQKMAPSALASLAV